MADDSGTKQSGLMPAGGSEVRAQPAKKPSIKDVARAAGVSVGTASNVLNHPDKVSPTTKQRVEEAIQALGFVPSITGRALQSGVSHLVGVIVLDISNPFFTGAVRAIEDRLLASNFYPMVCSSDGSPEKERLLIEQLASQLVRGMILVPSDQALKNIEPLTGRGTPVVFMDHPPISDSISTVSVDDEAGVAAALTHLHKLGHHRIAFINGPRAIRQARARHAGARSAAAKLGLDIVEISAARFNADSGERAMEWALKSQVTAVFCASDQLAIGAMRAIRMRGLEIPGDISIVGFDDIPIAGELITPLTTVRQPMRELGATAADLLLSSPDDPQHISFTPELVVRESTRRV